MFATFISVTVFFLLSIQGALAEFRIDTPARLVQCQDVKLNWADTKGPYNLVVVPGSDPCGTPLAEVGDFDKSEATWKVNLPAGTKVMFSVEDANDDEGWTGVVEIQPGDDSCLPGAAKKAAPTPTTTPKPASTPPADDGNAPDPVGAANAGSLPFSGKSGALSTRHLSTPALAFSALFAAVASLIL